MAYTTVDAVAAFLNVDPGNLTDFEQTQLDLLIPYVGGVIDSYCGYSLGAQDYVNRRYNGTGTSSFDLGVFPVNAITSLREKGSDGAFTDYTASVEALPDGMVQFLPEVGGTFTAGTGNIYVTFNAGWVTTPNDIAYAATYLVAINFNRIAWDLIGIKSQGATNGQTEYDSVELPVLVKRVLDRYRKLSIL